MTEAWSLTQRQYLEAMGYQLLTAGESTSSGASRHLLHVVEKEKATDTSALETFAAHSDAPSAPLPHSVEKGLPKEADDAALRLSPNLKSYLSKAAKIPYEDLANRVFLPPDLATNPHAKRAFWHILKSIRKS